VTIKIEEMTEAEFHFRIINTRSGYEEKAYSLQGALRLANEMTEKEIRDFRNER
jgi:hypothetical protein